MRFIQNTPISAIQKFCFFWFPYFIHSVDFWELKLKRANVFTKMKEVLTCLMNPVLKKIKFPELAPVIVLNAPESFRLILPEATVSFEITAEIKAIPYLLFFATNKKAVDSFADTYLNMLKGDSMLWICYPKGSSKKYHCDFNRDNGWNRVGAHGFEPVTQVAIDEDWSALRFRRTEFIKKITRSHESTISSAGKERTAPKKR